MPLPDSAFTITGGCNCGAIRYRVSVPPKAQRPLAFTLGQNLDPADLKTPRIPHVGACHCNDCRSASSSLCMTYVMTAAPDVTVSALPRSNVEESVRAVTGRIVERSTASSPEADADRPPYLSALDVLRPGLPGSEKTWLRFFHSFDCDAEIASRSFCGRCGAQVAFHCRPQAEWFGPLFKQPSGFSDVMDICLGTVDRHLLDRDDWFAVEHDICWKDALGWYRKTLCQGRGEEARQHPSGSLGEVLDRDQLLKDPKESRRFELT